MSYTIILLLLTYMVMLSDEQLLTFFHELVIELLTTISIPYNYFVRQGYDTPNMRLCQVHDESTAFLHPYAIFAFHPSLLTVS